MIFHTSNKMRSLKYPLIVTSLTEEQCTMCRDTTDVSGGGFGEGGDVACNLLQTDIDGLWIFHSLELGIAPSSPKLTKKTSLVESTGCGIRVVF